MMRSLVTHTKYCTNPLSYVGPVGELTVNTLTGVLYIHDGVTPGGNPFLNQITSQEVIEALGYTPINIALLGAPSGVAMLNQNGIVLSTELPVTTTATSQASHTLTEVVSSNNNNNIDGGFF